MSLIRKYQLCHVLTIFLLGRVLVMSPFLFYSSFVYDAQLIHFRPVNRRFENKSTTYFTDTSPFPSDDSVYDILNEWEN